MAVDADGSITRHVALDPGRAWALAPRCLRLRRWTLAGGTATVRTLEMGGINLLSNGS